MIKLEVQNISTRLVCARDLYRIISDQVLSYEQPGMEHRKRNMPVWVKWDGRTRLLKPNGTFPTGLLPEVISFLQTEKMEFEVEDLRIVPDLLDKFEVNFPWPLRSYQSGLPEYTDKNPRGIVLAGTGAGKGAMMAVTIASKGNDTLVCVPDVGLREQLFRSFDEWFDDEVSKDVTSDATIIVCNIDSLVNKDKKYFKRFKVLITDEYHHSSASSYLKLNKLCINCYWRYGFTGTNVRTDGTEMVLRGVLSNIIYEKSTSDLIEEGYLVPADITFYRLQLKGFSKFNYREAYQAVVFNDDFARIVGSLINNEIMMGYQTLVLVRRKEHGSMLDNLCPDAVYLSGDDPVEHRDEVKRQFNNKEVRCIIATSIFGEGQDIPNIDSLFNVRLQKGEIETKQGIGRALRLADGSLTYEDSVKRGKAKARVFDFLLIGNRHLSSHSVERINQYKSERAFNIRVERLKDYDQGRIDFKRP